MFVAGAIPALVLVPLMIRHLPESQTFLAAADGPTRPASAGIEAVRALFGRRLLRATLAFWATSFMGLLLVYGLNTWLPQIVREAGYPLGAALGLLLTLNVGAVVGLLVAGQVADRFGVRPSTIGWFVGAAAFLSLLSAGIAYPWGFYAFALVGAAAAVAALAAGRAFVPEQEPSTTA